MKHKSLFIAVQPVASKFAKALQSSLRDKVVNRIYRVDHQTTARKRAQNKTVFAVTQQTLNKVVQLERFTRAGVSCPRYTTRSDGIRGLECKTLFARTLINATSGRGIIEFESDDGEYPDAPLYTEYIPKKAEYRVHIFNSVVIDVQQKKKKRNFETENRDTRVRNLHNGYVYTRDGIVPPDGLNDLAIRAVQAVGYNYGAVDVIYNEKRDACYVLEVNSRPGLMGTTLDKYSEALINMFNLTRKV